MLLKLLLSLVVVGFLAADYAYVDAHVDEPEEISEHNRTCPEGSGKPPSRRLKKAGGQQIQCGVNRFGRNRIVNGKTADPDVYPWMARLILKGQSGQSRYDLYCGGSILNEYFILTAAHCLYPGKDPSFSSDRVVLGDYNADRIDPSEKTYRMAHKYWHPRYTDGDFSYDIGLVKLTEPIKWTESVRPICLPAKDINLKPGTNMTVTGFGTSSTSGSYVMFPEKLQVTHMPIASDATCRKFWGSLFDTRSILCAGAHDANGFLKSDACGGDSGGPGMMPLNDRWTQVALVSFGDPDCKRGYGGYTRVSYYIDWIASVMGRS